MNVMNKMTVRVKKIFAIMLAISRLIRFPNIVIIILTQFLLRYGILKMFLYSGNSEMMSSMFEFILLVLTTCLLAAGGYVINDYFDVRIDQVNKPEKMVIDRMVSSRTAMKIHLILSGIAMIIGFFLAYRLGSLNFGLIFPSTAFLLWLYSAKYKKSLLLGNFIVAFLGGLVIFIVWLFEFLHLRQNPGYFSELFLTLKPVNRCFLAYGLFAILTTMIREIIKDLEDAEGDSQFMCRTLPVVAGDKVAKWVTAGIVIITMGLLGYGLVVLYRIELMLVFWYFIFLVEMPSAYLLYKLISARTKDEYHFLSNLAKMIMLAGILSMQLLSI
jgi:4-hydroxybenzoate polyprenyltransferase